MKSMEEFLVKYTTKNHHQMIIRAHDEFDAASRVEAVAGREVYGVSKVTEVKEFRKE
jgi:hypothetical protein